MSNYKLIEVIKNISGQETQSIYDHTDMTTLLAALNNDFGAWIKNSDVASIYCLAIDNETGAKIDKYFYAKPIEGGEDPVEYSAAISIKSRVYTHNDYAADNVSAYDTYRLALGNYHTKVAAAMNKLECNQAITILIDAEGNYSEFSNWTR